MNDAPKVADAGVVIPEDLLETYEDASKFASHLGPDHETVDGMIVRFIKRIAALEAENRQLKEQVRKLSAPDLRYAVAWREQGETKWRGLAAYPWSDDPSGAERIKDFLEQTRALPFEYAIATLMIEEPAQTEGK